MENSNLRKVNKDRLNTFLKYLENKNSDEKFRKYLVSF